MEESGGLKSMGLHDWACVHEGGGRWVGSTKLVELKKKNVQDFNFVCVCVCVCVCVYVWNYKSLVAQTVKNPPVMQEMQVTRVWSLGQEDPLEEKMAPTPVFLPEKSHGQRSLEGYSPYILKYMYMYIYFKIYFYLFIWLHQVLVVIFDLWSLIFIVTCWIFLLIVAACEL